MCTVTCGGAWPLASRGSCEDDEPDWLIGAAVSAESFGWPDFDELPDVGPGAGAGGAVGRETAFTPGSFMPGGGGAGGNWLADWAIAEEATATPRTTSNATGFMMTAS